MHVDKKTFILSAVINEHTYNMFSLIKEHHFCQFLYFWPQPYIIKCQKWIFECVCFVFCILQRVYRTRKFLVCPETFGLNLLVSFLVSVSVPISPNFKFLVLFRYPFSKILAFLVLFRYPETYFCLFPKPHQQQQQKNYHGF